MIRNKHYACKPYLAVWRKSITFAILNKELEDIRSICEAKGEKTEPIDIFFERVEKYRKENGIS